MWLVNGLREHEIWQRHLDSGEIVVGWLGSGSSSTFDSAVDKSYAFAFPSPKWCNQHARQRENKNVGMDGQVNTLTQETITETNKINRELVGFSGGEIGGTKGERMGRRKRERMRKGECERIKITNQRSCLLD